MMKLPEPTVDEVIIFIVVISIIGWICAVALIPFAVYGLYTKIFEVKDYEKTQAMD